MKFPYILEDVKSLPVNQIHLRKSTFKTFENKNIFTIGQLIGFIDFEFPKSKSLTKGEKNDVERKMEAFTASINEFGNFDIFAYCKKLNVPIIPIPCEKNLSLEDMLKAFPLLAKEILTFGRSNDRYWQTIQRRFGLNKTEKLTLDEIGQAFSVTRERIRQIEAEAILNLREVLYKNIYVGKKYHVHPIIIKTANIFNEIIFKDAKNFEIETELLERLKKVNSIDLSKYRQSLAVFLKIFGWNEIRLESNPKTKIWTKESPKNYGWLNKIIEIVDELLTDTYLEPLSEFDILIRINKKLSSSKKVDLVKIRRGLELCESIEQTEDGLYQGKFEYLQTRSHQAERILVDAGEPLHIDKITREMNYQLHQKGKKKINTRNISNIMSTDGRFEAIGSSGLRGMKKWENIESKTITDLMEESLISFNRPASDIEIHKYISERRPAKLASVKMYLVGNEKFAKAGYKKWGLKTWKETKEAITWSPTQVGEFVEQFFKDRKIKEIEFNSLTKALMKKANISSNEASGMLRKNPSVKSRRELPSYKIYAVFNKSYKQELTKENLRIKRKKKTKFQIAQEIVEKLIKSESSKQIELSKLVKNLVLQHNFHEKTAYGYISKMKFIEKITLPNGIRICNFKEDTDYKFPQIKELEILNISKAKEAKKAISKLTLDEVDIGLFILGRMFENTLKEFIKTVEKMGSFPVSEGNYKTLNNMIQWVESKNIITDKTALNFLRGERNDKAHVSPSSKERGIMLKSSPWVANLYLDYIVFLEKKKNAL